MVKQVGEATDRVGDTEEVEDLGAFQNLRTLENWLKPHVSALCYIHKLGEL